MAGIRSLATLVVMAGTACLMTPALAADMPVKAPAYTAVVPSWTGFYVGLNAGYGWGHASTNLVPNDIVFGFLDTFLPTSVSSHPTGAIGGGQIGFNQQFGRWVAGLEADIDFAGVKKQETATGPQFIGGIPTLTAETKLNWFGTARGRLGFLAADTLLIYATGGLAYGDVQTMTTVGNGLGCTGNICGSGSTSGISTGWALGGGLEYMLSPHVTLRGEYLHMDFGDRSVSFTAPNLPGSGFASTTSFKFQVARAALSYKF